MSLVGPHGMAHALQNAGARHFPPSKRAELWRPLAMLAIAFLLIETFLAWRFGHYSGGMA